MTPADTPAPDAPAWDGVPEEPGRDGWHWITDTPMLWRASDQTWHSAEYMMNQGWVREQGYFGPVLTPEEVRVLREKTSTPHHSTFGPVRGKADLNPERIYLEPGDGSPDDGRLWSQDDVWAGDAAYAEFGPAVEYVRADLVLALRAAVQTEGRG